VLPVDDEAGRQSAHMQSERWVGGCVWQHNIHNALRCTAVI
jgi:hypothetical protein